MNRTVALIVGVVCYAVFFATFLYLVGFVGGIAVPKTVDSGPAGPLGTALLVNTGLIALFGLQHSVMARPGFKARWTRIVPGPIERPVYCLATSAVLILLFWQWRPIAAPVWDVHTPVVHAALQTLYFAGVGLVLYSTFLIDHFDLFGLRQVFLHFRNKPYTEKRFMTPSLYRFVRHPLYVGWFTVFWATPTMTAGHFLLALGMSGYILLAIPMEERDLGDALGEPYRRWRERTPAFVPGVRPLQTPGQPVSETE
jgi:protein-S-isoprenylcysteine O-methyltransferase Ste14